MSIVGANAVVTMMCIAAMCACAGIRDAVTYKFCKDSDSLDTRSRPLTSITPITAIQARRNLECNVADSDVTSKVEAVCNGKKDCYVLACRNAFGFSSETCTGLHSELYLKAIVLQSLSLSLL